MTFLEKLQIMERVDGLIRRRGTGPAVDLASRLGVSRSTVFEILRCMKDLGGEIEYDTGRRSYYYTEEMKLILGFQKKEIEVGGKGEKYGHPIYNDGYPFSL